MPWKLELTGQRFGKLTVLSEIPERRHGGVVWLCRCECGNQCSVVGSKLSSGKTRSCGCLGIRFGEDHPHWAGGSKNSGSLAHCRIRLCKNLSEAKKRQHEPVSLSGEELVELVKEHDGLCDICQRDYDKILALDHCHKTGQFRGFLCHFCNTALGQFDDDPQILKTAIKYLEGSHEICEADR